MEIDLIRQLETEITECETLVESITDNVSHFITEDQHENLYETAHGFLGKLAAALQAGKPAVGNLDANQTAAMLTALRMVGSAEARTGFNISTDDFSKIIRLADSDPNVTKFLINKIGNHESARQSLEKHRNLLTSFGEMDENARKETLNMINKLRLGYEKAHAKTGTRQPEQRPQMGSRPARPAFQ